MYIVDYCKYSNWGYKKTTCIWTNKKDWQALVCKNDCNNIITKQKQKLHKARMGTSKTIMDGDKIIRCNTAELRQKYKNYKNINKTINNETTQLDRYRIPEDLIFSLFLD